MLERRIVRQVYWTLRRTIEVMRDEGLSGVAESIGVKLRLALRGHHFLVKARGPISRDLDTQYSVWLRTHHLTEARRRDIEATLASLPYTPRVSVLTVLNPGEEPDLGELLGVMRNQIYPDWELCVAISPSADVGAFDRMMVSEPRLHIARGHGSLSLHATAVGLASGELIALLRAGDRLAPDALFEVVRRLNDDPDLDVIYADEDRLTREGERVDPFFKPDWSPDLLLSTNYLGRFLVMRRKLLDDIGGFRSRFEGDQEYDVALRAGERTGRIAHLPEVLHHRGERLLPGVEPIAPRVSDDLGKRAVEEALQRRGLTGRVELIDGRYHDRHCYRVSCEVGSEPLVSIIIPTRDKWRLLDQCLKSVVEKTTYRNYEIVIVDNDSKDRETLAYLDSLAGSCRILRFPGRFNFAQINNFAVTHARGDCFLFLNNDIVAIAPDWLGSMLAHAQRPEVGAVGAKLLYPDGRIQHAGMVVGMCGSAGHPFRREPGTAPEPRQVDLRGNCSAVTAACMLTPRRVFEQVGGFDERFKVVFNDVDLCLRIRRAGYLIVYEPGALLYHHELATRGKLEPSGDRTLFDALWADYIQRGDPYYNPNFSLASENVALR